MPNLNQKYYSYCCIIGSQLDLTCQKKEVANSYQINTFFLKLATDLLQETKEKTGLCPLCNNFLTNLKDFSHNRKNLAHAKSLLTHQDLVEEMQGGYKGFAIPDKHFHPREKKAALSKLKEIAEKIEQRTPI
ncbi:1486_t:CDS:2 [Entrophospora sp. SA101]|nr:1486_t:CDS:2 [Entrophospora sp. SA101]